MKFVIFKQVANQKYNYKYNGKELQSEFGVEMYDFGNRNYDPTIARFYNMDKFSEKYVDKTPYHYTANNPIYFVDIKGDSLVVNGASSGLAKFESIVNKGLGGHYTISQNNSGKYILNDTGSDKSTMTNSQKSFYNTMNESATNAGDVVFTVIEHSGTASNKVFVGDHGGIQIVQVQATI